MCKHIYIYIYTHVCSGRLWRDTRRDTTAGGGARRGADGRARPAPTAISLSLSLAISLSLSIYLSLSLSICICIYTHTYKQNT